MITNESCTLDQAKPHGEFDSGHTFQELFDAIQNDPTNVYMKIDVLYDNAHYIYDTSNGCDLVIYNSWIRIRKIGYENSRYVSFQVYPNEGYDKNTPYFMFSFKDPTSGSSISGLNMTSAVVDASVYQPAEDTYYPIDGRYVPIDGSTVTLNSSGQLQAAGGGTSVSGTNDGTNWTSLTIGSSTYGLLSTSVNNLQNYTLSSSLAAVATTGAYSDLSGTPTIPDAVSGTNDGTNWTSLTIGSTTYGIPSGGGGSGVTAQDEAIGLLIGSATADNIPIGSDPVYIGELNYAVSMGNYPKYLYITQHDEYGTLLENYPCTISYDGGNEITCTHGGMTVDAKTFTVSGIASAASSDLGNLKLAIYNMGVADGDFFEGVATYIWAYRSSGTQSQSSSYKIDVRTKSMQVFVNGTNDGTNWTSLTVGNSTYAIPAGAEETLCEARVVGKGYVDELTVDSSGTTYIGKINTGLNTNILPDLLLTYVQNSTSNSTLQPMSLTYTGSTKQCTLPDETVVTAKQFQIVTDGRYVFIYMYCSDEPTTWAGAVKAGETHIWASIGSQSSYYTHKMIYFVEMTPTQILEKTKIYQHQIRFQGSTTSSTTITGNLWLMSKSSNPYSTSTLLSYLKAGYVPDNTPIMCQA